jgi:hypothetical protein
MAPTSSSKAEAATTTKPTELYGATLVPLPRVAIKFCVQCKWNLRAAYVSSDYSSYHCLIYFACVILLFRCLAVTKELPCLCPCLCYIVCLLSQACWVQADIGLVSISPWYPIVSCKFSDSLLHTIVVLQTLSKFPSPVYGHMAGL